MSDAGSNGYDWPALFRRVEEVERTAERVELRGSQLEGVVVDRLAKIEQGIYAQAGETNGLRHSMNRRAEDAERGEEAARIQLALVNSTVMDIRQEQAVTLREVAIGNAAIIEMQKTIDTALVAIVKLLKAKPKARR